MGKFFTPSRRALTLYSYQVKVRREEQELKEMEADLAEYYEDQEDD